MTTTVTDLIKSYNPIKAGEQFDINTALPVFQSKLKDASTSDKDKSDFCKGLMTANIGPADLATLFIELLKNKTLELKHLATAINSLKELGYLKIELRELFQQLPGECQIYLGIHSILRFKTDALNSKSKIALFIKYFQTASDAEIKKVAEDLKSSSDKILPQLFEARLNTTLGFGGISFAATEQGQKLADALFDQTPDKIIGDNCLLKAVSPAKVYSYYFQKNFDVSKLSIPAVVQKKLFEYYCQNESLSDKNFNNYFKDCLKTLGRRSINKLLQKMFPGKDYLNNGLYHAIVKEHSAIPLAMLPKAQQKEIYTIFLQKSMTGNPGRNPLEDLPPEQQKAVIEHLFDDITKRSLLNKFLDTLPDTSKPELIQHLFNYSYNKGEDFNKTLDVISGLTIATYKASIADPADRKYLYTLINTFRNLSQNDKLIWLRKKMDPGKPKFYFVISYLDELSLQYARAANKTRKNNFKKESIEFVKMLSHAAPEQIEDLAIVYQAHKNSADCQDISFITEAFADVLAHSDTIAAEAHKLISQIALAEKDDLGRTESIKQYSGVIVDILAKVYKKDPRCDRLALIIFGLDKTIKNAVMSKLVESDHHQLISKLFSNHNFTAEARAKLLSNMRDENNNINKDNIKKLVRGLNPAQVALMAQQDDFSKQAEVVKACFESLFAVREEQGAQKKLRSLADVIDLNQFSSILPSHQTAYYKQLATIVDGLLTNGKANNSYTDGFKKSLEYFLGLSRTNPSYFKNIYKKLPSTIKQNIKDYLQTATCEQLINLKPVIHAEDLAALMETNNDRILLLNKILADKNFTQLAAVTAYLFQDLNKGLTSSNNVQIDYYCKNSNKLQLLLVQPDIPIKHLYQFVSLDKIKALLKDNLARGNYAACRSILFEGLNNTKKELNIFREIIGAHVRSCKDDNIKLLVKNIPCITVYLSKEALQKIEPLIEEKVTIYHPSR